MKTKTTLFRSPGLKFAARVSLVFAALVPGLAAAEPVALKVLGSLETGPAINAIAFSPDGKSIAYGGADNTLTILNDSGEKRSSIELSRNGAVLVDLAFSPDSKRIVTGRTRGTDNDESTVRVWDVASGREAVVLRGVPNVSSSSVAFSPDGKSIAAGMDLGGEGAQALFLWDSATGAQLLSINGHGGPVAFSPDSQRLVSGNRRGLAVLETGAGDEIISFPAGEYGGARSVAVDPGGKRITSGNNDGSISIWDTGSGAEIAHLDGHGSPVNGVAFSPEGSLIASCGDDGMFHLWKSGNGEKIAFHKGADPIKALAFSPDVESLLSGDGAGIIRVMKTVAGGKAPPGERVGSLNNLRNLAMGIHELYSRTEGLGIASAPSFGRGEGPRRPVSWRVQILPYIGYEQLFEAYRFGEAWDSEHNLSLLKDMPRIFGANAGGSTRFMVFTGKDTVWSTNEPKPFPFREGSDEPGETIMVVEAGPDKAVPWTQPVDLPLDPAQPASVLGKLAPDSFNVAFVDGSVRRLPSNIAPEDLKALITPRGGEDVDLDAILDKLKKEPASVVQVKVSNGSRGGWVTGLEVVAESGIEALPAEAGQQHYDFMLRPGVYELVVQTPGLTFDTRRIEVGAGRQNVELVPSGETPPDDPVPPVDNEEQQASLLDRFDTNRDFAVDHKDFSPEGWLDMKVFDTNGDGNINAEELGDLASKKSARRASEPRRDEPPVETDRRAQAARLHARLDSNLDERVDKDDFSAEGWSDLREQLGKADTDTLSPDDLLTLIQTRPPRPKSAPKDLPPELSREQIAENLHKRLDSNFDDMVDQQDFSADGWLDLKKFDTDGDGMLSAAELLPSVKLAREPVKEVDIVGPDTPVTPDGPGRDTGPGTLTIRTYSPPR